MKKEYVLKSELKEFLENRIKTSMHFLKEMAAGNGHQNNVQGVKQLIHKGGVNVIICPYCSVIKSYLDISEKFEIQLAKNLTKDAQQFADIF